MIISLYYSCKEDNENLSEQSLTEEETIFISKESGRIIDQYIENILVTGDVLDIDALSKEIELIKGVKSATPAKSGEIIYIEQENGFFTNAFVLQMDDKRIVKEISTDKAESAQKIQLKNENNSLKTRENISTQVGKAIILDPFNFSVKEESTTLISVLEGMGYEVDYYPNEKADLSKFNGDNLRQYEIVYIMTHGAKDAKGRFGDTFAGSLSTGEEFDEDYYNNLPMEERRLLGGCDHTYKENDKKITKKYFCITDEWLQYTTKGSYPNSWVFLNVCSGFVFSDYFLRNGAGGVNGFNSFTMSTLGNHAVVEMARLLKQGNEFNIASASVQQSIPLKIFRWVFFTTLRLFGKDVEKTVADIKYFSYLRNDNLKYFYIKRYSEETGFFAGTAFNNTAWNVTIKGNGTATGTVRSSKYVNGNKVYYTEPWTDNNDESYEYSLKYSFHDDQIDMSAGGETGSIYIKNNQLYIEGEDGTLESYGDYPIFISIVNSIEIKWTSTANTTERNDHITYNMNYIYKITGDKISGSAESTYISQYVGNDPEYTGFTYYKSVNKETLSGNKTDYVKNKSLYSHTNSKNQMDKKRLKYFISSKLHPNLNE